MIDKVIHKHLDKLDALGIEVSEAVDKIIATIDIDKIIDNSNEEIMRVIDDIHELILEEFNPKAVKIGNDFAEAADNLSRDIKVSDSTNPKLNKDIME